MKQLNDALCWEMSGIWLSDEVSRVKQVSRVKPTPEKEAEKGTLIVESILWEALPQHMRKLDATAKEMWSHHRWAKSGHCFRFFHVEFTQALKK